MLLNPNTCAALGNRQKERWANELDGKRASNVDDANTETQLVWWTQLIVRLKSNYLWNCDFRSKRQLNSAYSHMTYFSKYMLYGLRINSGYRYQPTLYYYDSSEPECLNQFHNFGVSFFLVGYIVHVMFKCTQIGIDSILCVYFPCHAKWIAQLTTRSIQMVFINQTRVRERIALK